MTIYVLHLLVQGPVLVYCRLLEILRVNGLLAIIILLKMIKPTEEKPLVYHIFGDMNIPNSMVLTERNYFEFVINLNRNEDKDILPSIIRKQLATSSLLFIGYSLEDINFRTILQGFLSFISSISSEFRKPSISVQIPPTLSNKAQIKVQRYLEQYIRNMFDVRVYWGSTYDFIAELHRRWQDFKKSDMKKPVYQ
jgi:hypothetical protein